MPISPEWPVWYQPEAPLGSAVRHLAGLSPRFDRVTIYVSKGKFLEPGPSMGRTNAPKRIPIAQAADRNIPDVHALESYLACSLETQSELVVLIRGKGGRILGQIDIDSRSRATFGLAEEKAVRQIAMELGDLWPA